MPLLHDWCTVSRFKWVPSPPMCWTEYGWCSSNIGATSDSSRMTLMLLVYSVNTAFWKISKNLIISALDFKLETWLKSSNIDFWIFKKNPIVLPRCQILKCYKLSILKISIRVQILNATSVQFVRCQIKQFQVRTCPEKISEMGKKQDRQEAAFWHYRKSFTISTLQLVSLCEYRRSQAPVALESITMEAAAF